MPHPPQQNARRLNDLLRDTSRSFYLTLRVLPKSVRSQIGLAYLLARISDTIADTEILPPNERLASLRRFRNRLLEKACKISFSDIAQKQSLAAEKLLLERCEEALLLFDQLEPADHKRVLNVLETIVSGQELDLQRFADASSANIVALKNEAELDDYTYRVAGCVGEFWTQMCRAHVFPKAKLDDALLLKNGARFGKGLQLVNILRDIPADLQKGRCYVPADRLAQIGLAPSDLLFDSNMGKFQPLLREYLHNAHEHLAAGWNYTNALPRRCIRVRLACAWPILIGVKTLRQLRQANVLDTRQRIKISRADVKKILWRTVISAPFPGAWRKLFDEAS